MTIDTVGIRRWVRRFVRGVQRSADPERAYLYDERQRLSNALAAAEQRATGAEARATKAATYLRQTYSDLRTMALSAGHTRDALGIVTSLRIDAPVLFRIQSRLDAACADCDAFSVAPATQPDERAAVIKAALDRLAKRILAEIVYCAPENRALAEEVARVAKIETDLIVARHGGAAKEV